MVSGAPRPPCLHLGDDPTTPWRAAGERDGASFPVVPEPGQYQTHSHCTASSVQGVRRMKRERLVTDCPGSLEYRTRVGSLLEAEEDSSQVNRRVGDLTWRLATRSASQLDSRPRPVLAGGTPQTTLGTNSQASIHLGHRRWDDGLAHIP